MPQKFVEADADQGRLHLLTVVIPARNEEGCIRSTVEHLDCRTAVKDYRPRLQLGRNSDCVAKPADGRAEVKAERNGKPLFVHLSLHMA